MGSAPFNSGCPAVRLRVMKRWGQRCLGGKCLGKKALPAGNPELLLNARTQRIERLGRNLQQMQIVRQSGELHGQEGAGRCSLLVAPQSSREARKCILLGLQAQQARRGCAAGPQRRQPGLGREAVGKGEGGTSAVEKQDPVTRGQKGLGRDSAAPPAAEVVQKAHWPGFQGNFGAAGRDQHHSPALRAQPGDEATHDLGIARSIRRFGKLGDQVHFRHQSRGAPALAHAPLPAAPRPCPNPGPRAAALGRGRGFPYTPCAGAGFLCCGVVRSFCPTASQRWPWADWRAVS